LTNATKTPKNQVLSKYVNQFSCHEMLYSHNSVAEDLVFWDMACQVSCTIRSAVTRHVSHNLNL